MVTQTSHGKCDRNKEAVRLRDLYLPLRFEKNDNIILEPVFLVLRVSECIV